jgi:hypothetical protein
MFGLPLAPNTPPMSYGIPGPGGIMPQPGQMPPPPTGYLRPAGTYNGPPAAYYNLAGQQQQRLGLPAPGSLAPPGPPPPQKAFGPVVNPYSATNYYSAYMNLFRTDNGGTIDNYSTLVRPALQQQSINQQYGADIYGLDRQYRIQQAMQQSPYNVPRTLQGVGTPQYFMNFGRFYQGSSSYFAPPVSGQGYGYGSYGYGGNGGVTGGYYGQ